MQYKYTNDTGSLIKFKKIQYDDITLVMDIIPIS